MSGKFAPIAKSREFTVVPWRPVLERSLVKSVVGIVCGESNSWTLKCQRGGPGISCGIVSSNFVLLLTLYKSRSGYSKTIIREQA